ncbi:DUF2304 domain-containing protein [Candidatus Uhrbacteria bacterium]|nr:DUF2304 domain-containing protein [Candidatus Uhrbacteria bacterium]
MVIQVLVTAISLFVVGKAATAYVHKRIRIPAFVIWALFWVAIIVVVWQPNLTDRLAALLQVGRGADAVFYLSLVVIFYLLFRIYIRFERIDSHITTLVREIAILNKRVDDTKK